MLWKKKKKNIFGILIWINFSLNRLVLLVIQDFWLNLSAICWLDMRMPVPPWLVSCRHTVRRLMLIFFCISHRSIIVGPLKMSQSDLLEKSVKNWVPSQRCEDVHDGTRSIDISGWLPITFPCNVLLTHTQQRMKFTCTRMIANRANASEIQQQLKLNPLKLITISLISRLQLW